tara:strand:+ start:19083 stop:19661 length:579 start_codon:yes stop_codon:yes gene_type:complete
MNMFIKPVQLLRFFTLLLIIFVGFQLLNLIQFKQSENSYGSVVFEISRQQLLVPRILKSLQIYKKSPTDENLIALNSVISLFKSTQKKLVSSSALIDEDGTAISGNLNDQVLTFLNETERQKSSLFEIGDDYLVLASETLPNEYFLLLNNFTYENDERSDYLETRVVILIISLLALVLQSFMIFYFEREIRL